MCESIAGAIGLAYQGSMSSLQSYTYRCRFYSHNMKYYNDRFTTHSYTAQLYTDKWAMSDILAKKANRRRYYV